MWRILDSNENGLLIVTNNILFFEVFGENNKWKDSNLREWLNSERNGFLALFSPNQRKLINEVSISTKYNGSYEDEKERDQEDIVTNGIASTDIVEYFTQDKVFILSELEYQEYLNDEILDFGKAKIFKVSDKFIPYWLRTMDDIYNHSDAYPSDTCLFVDAEGGVTHQLENGLFLDNLVKSTAKAGVRPAIYLKNANIIEGLGTENNPFIIEQ